jgi:hypothetical protein
VLRYAVLPQTSELPSATFRQTESETPELQC